MPSMCALELASIKGVKAIETVRRKNQSHWKLKYVCELRLTNEGLTLLPEGNSWEDSVGYQDVKSVHVKNEWNWFVLKCRYWRGVHHFWNVLMWDDLGLNED